MKGTIQKQNSQLVSNQLAEISLAVPNLPKESSALYSGSHWMESELTMSQGNQILQSSLWFIHREAPGATHT